MSKRHVLTVVLESHPGLANDMAATIRAMAGVVSVTPQLVRDSQISSIQAGVGGDQYVEVMGVEAMNAKAAEGYVVVAGWSYGAGSIALMERR
jgi:hypothetical protein